PANVSFLATNADTLRASAGDVLYRDQRNRSQPSRPVESEAASSSRLKPGRRRTQAAETASFVPALPAISTSSTVSCFSGSSRVRPSLTVVTVQSAGVLTVAPDVSVTVRSAGPGAGAPAGRGVQPDRIARTTSITT